MFKVKPGRECKYCGCRYENICSHNDDVDLNTTQKDYFTNCEGYEEDPFCIDIERKSRRDHLEGEFETLEDSDV